MSYVNLRYHIIFGTKDHQPLLSPQVLPRICEFTAGMIRQQGGHPLLVNGVEDHLHIVASIPATNAISNSLRDLKANSTNWIHETFPEMKLFFWQEGYSTFTVSQSVLPGLLEYVRNQREHHKKVSFRDELILFLRKNEIEFDERYL